MSLVREQPREGVAQEPSLAVPIRPGRGVDTERLDDWCERGILGLVLAILIYSPLVLGAVRTQEFVVVQWLTVALLGVWGCRFWLNPKHRLLWPPVCWGVVLFMGYAVGRYLTAEIEYVARLEMIRVLVYGFVFLAVLNNLHRLETTQVVGMTVLFLGMAIAFYGIVQFLTESDHVWHFLRPEGYRKRASGTFICPNHLAGYLEMILPLGLVYTLTGRFNHVVKVLLCYASLVIFTGITVTVSRGGWIATAITLVALFLWLMRQRDYRLQGTLLLLALVAIGSVFFLRAELSPNRKDRIATIGQSDDVRFALWKPANQMWQDHPWWGVGPAHFDYRFPQYRPAHFSMQWDPLRVHNDYLNTLVDWGIVGAAIVAGTWALFYAGIFWSWKFVQRAQNDFTAKRSNKASFVMGGALGLLAILLHSFVDFNMHIPSNAILAVTLMALVSGYFRFSTESYWHTVRWPMRWVVTVVLLAGIGYLGEQAWLRTRECYWQAQADAVPDFSMEQVARLEKVFATEDRNPETPYRIGECLRVQSWAGAPGYQALAEQALDWYRKGLALNPYDTHDHLRSAMCLDWLGRHQDALLEFQKGQGLDPNSYYVKALLGWHSIQVEDWATAKNWLYQSLLLLEAKNSIAHSYMRIVEEKLAAQPSPSANLPPKRAP